MPVPPVLAAALEHYTLGALKTTKKLESSRENDVYRVTTAQGAFVVKLARKTDAKALAYRLTAQALVRDHGIAVPHTIATKDGRPFAQLPEGVVTVQRFVEGTTVERFDQQLLQLWGRTLATIDKELLSFPVSRRGSWTDTSRWKRPWRDDRIIGGVNVDAVRREACRHLRRLTLRRSVVYGDMNQENVLLAQGELVTLDWDDVHDDYLVFDLAVTLAHLYAYGRVPLEKLAVTLEAYERVLPLSSQERVALYWCMRSRLASGLLWCEEHLLERPHALSWLTQGIGASIELEQLGLERFLVALANAKPPAARAPQA